MTLRVPDVLVRCLAALALAALTVAPAACGAGDLEDDPQPAAAEAAASAENGPSGSQPVDYEPAYPEAVSGEELTEEDVAQQAAPHSHGGEAHTHAEGEDPEHGDGGHDH